MVILLICHFSKNFFKNSSCDVRDGIDQYHVAHFKKVFGHFFWFLTTPSNQGRKVRLPTPRQPLDPMWKEIPDFPGYSVSSIGAVRNDRTGRCLSQFQNRHGTAYVNLFRDGEGCTRAVSLLVALAFVNGERSEAYDTPIHLNGDRGDNRASNLVWRPRWFAIKYTMQFRYPMHGGDLLLEDLDTGERLTGWDATVKHGLLYRDVMVAAISTNPDAKSVWPTGRRFNVVLEKTNTTSRKDRGL